MSIFGNNGSDKQGWNDAERGRNNGNKPGGSDTERNGYDKGFHVQNQKGDWPYPPPNPAQK